MSIQAAIVTLLKGFAPLAALVGCKIFPAPADQGALAPFVTYQRISATEDQGLGGSHGVIRARYQITAWSDNFNQCIAAGDQIRMALVGFSGTVHTPSGDDVVIQEIFSWGDQELFDSKARVYFNPHDMEISYEAAIPNPTP